MNGSIREGGNPSLARGNFVIGASPAVRRPYSRSGSEPRNGIGRWRSRLVMIGIVLSAIVIYVAGIVWFGQGLAEDMRSGLREVRAGSLIGERER
jgi:hypothetical protein